MKKIIKGKVYVFIDAANIFYTQRSLKWRISYEKLEQYFKEECGDNLGKMFIYTAYDKDRPQQKKFLDMLEINGYILRTKEVKRIRVAKGLYEWKGDFDVELSMDVMDNLTEFETMVLLSGDSDFAPIVKRAKDGDKKIIIMSAKNHISRELIQLADKYINLKKLRDKIELK
ncbi:MAG: NYN domain-containing protein [Patescibacteria group bacterium]|nr:NYN domain-containing protein [Patescibacteria group bacterium]